MRLFYLATKPLVELFNGLGNLLLRPFGIPPAREVGHAPHSESELLELLAESGEQGLIEVEEQRFAERGFAFADRHAQDVMQPRGAIDFVLSNIDVAEAARQAVRLGHTRLPVCDPELGLDGPVGLIHVHDLLSAVLADPTIELSGLLRPLARVPPDTPVTDLLRRMRDERRHMVLVSDAHDQTVGLLTLEDLLEELVGEIENDTDSPLPTPSPERTVGERETRRRHGRPVSAPANAGPGRLSGRPPRADRGQDEPA